MTQFSKGAQAATAAMRALFPPTPLQHNVFLSQAHGAEIWLKREDLSPVRSYKLRGAFNAMRKMREHHPEVETFVCASAGNHAQGVAFVCRHFGVRGVIYMPVTTPRQKIDKTRAFGGDFVEIVLEGDIFDQTLSAAQAYCAQVGGHFLSPFDDPDVIEGQSSVAVEIGADMAPPDVIILPVGGGGLSAGMVSYARSQGWGTEFLFVEPQGGASLALALAKGAPTTLNHVDTFVDGAAVARLGDRTFEVLRETDPANVLSAPEDRICSTILTMLNIEGIVLEPAGALSLDVLPLVQDRIQGKRVLCVTSGGNFDFERLPEVKERSMLHEGLKKYYVLRLPQRPGALRDFLALLGPSDDIARFEYLKKSARNFGSVLIGIESTDPDGLDALEGRMQDSGLTYRDITTDETLAAFLI